jgi:hypothetical protein
MVRCREERGGRGGERSIKFVGKVLIDFRGNFHALDAMGIKGSIERRRGGCGSMLTRGRSTASRIAQGSRVLLNSEEAIFAAAAQIGMIAGLSEAQEEFQDVRIVLHDGAVFDKAVELGFGLFPERIIERLFFRRKVVHLYGHFARREVYYLADLALGIDVALILGTAQEERSESGL